MDKLRNLSIAEAIKDYRTHRHLTRKEMADILTVSKSAISRYESGKRRPDKKTMKEINRYMPWLVNDGNPLECVFDYVRVRILDATVDEVITKLLNLNPKTFDDEGHGLLHYDSCLSRGHIKVLYDHNRVEGNSKGVLVEMTGQGCREYEVLLSYKKFDWNTFFVTAYQDFKCYFKRIDIAINDYYGIVDIPDLIEKTKRGEIGTRFKKVQFQGGIEIVNSTGATIMRDSGSSIYFGAPKSNLRIVFYQKDLETFEKTEVYHENYVPIKNRYEIRLMDDYAEDAVLNYCRFDHSFQSITLGIINSYICYYEPTASAGAEDRYEPWRQLIQDADEIQLKAKPKENNFDHSVTALTKQYGPTLSMLAAYQARTGDNLFEKIISEAKMKRRQEKMLDTKLGEFDEIYGDYDWGMNEEW